MLFSTKMLSNSGAICCIEKFEQISIFCDSQLTTLVCWC